MNTQVPTPASSGALNPDGNWRHFIGGSWVDSADARSRDVINPADGITVARAAEAGESDVDAAVGVARSAFERGTWRLKSPQSRSAALLRLAQLIRERSEDLALLDTLCNGMPLKDARAMLKRCSTSLEYAAGIPQRAYGQTIPVGDRYLDLTVREPIGVCALIVPWNGPLISAIWKLGPAIALGNSVVLKPSELTPLSALALAELCQLAGVPDGVVNVVTGGGETGRLLVAHPDVSKIAFTGSTATGKAIMEVAARQVKRVTLELGGKAPNIFFEDVDISDAALGAISALMRNTGQTCVAGARMLIHESRHDEFVEKVLHLSKALRVGNPMESDTQLGPIVSQAQLDRVQGYVANASAAGAEVHGTEILTGGDLDGGYFMAPGVIIGTDNSMSVNREEIFGPVGAVIPFSDEEEAVSIANDTPYGLAAGVWTRDIKRAMRVTKAVKAGTVWVNTYGWNFTETPMGGFKESGIGRENGDAVIDAYTETKNIVVELSDSDSLDAFRLRGAL